jgi:hypothetical protein
MHLPEVRPSFVSHCFGQRDAVSQETSICPTLPIRPTPARCPFRSVSFCHGRFSLGSSCFWRFIVGAEDGATSLISGMYVHEFVHDGRHLLEQFSAVVLWRFRVGSLGIHVVLWTTIGLLFGALAERSFAERFGQRLSVGAVRR